MITQEGGNDHADTLTAEYMGHDNDHEVCTNIVVAEKKGHEDQIQIKKEKRKGYT